MQRNLSNKIQLGDTLNPLQDYGGVPAISDEETWKIYIVKLIR